MKVKDEIKSYNSAHVSELSEENEGNHNLNNNKEFQKTEEGKASVTLSDTGNYDKNDETASVKDHIIEGNGGDKSANELIVDNEKFKKYLNLKKRILIKKIVFAIFQILFIIAMTGFYYVDLAFDIKLCYGYFKFSNITLNDVFNETQYSTDIRSKTSPNDYNFVFGVITILIITIVHFFLVIYCCRTELREQWNQRQFKPIIIRIFRILFYLEMFYW